METCNCQNCNKLFNYFDGVKLCFECDKLLFEKVRNYLYDNPGKTTKKIADATEVDVSIIQQYLKDDRLSVLKYNCADLDEEYNKRATINNLKLAFNMDKNETYVTARMRFLNQHDEKGYRSSSRFK